MKLKSLFFVNFAKKTKKIFKLNLNEIMNIYLSIVSFVGFVFIFFSADFRSLAEGSLKYIYLGA